MARPLDDLFAASTRSRAPTAEPGLAASSMGTVVPPDLHVMTLNIRRRIDRPLQRASDRWTDRAPRLDALLRAERPTLLALQEVLPDQAARVRAALGGTFRRIGRGSGREGRGEGCPLFYDSARLELVEAEQTALSATPHIPGSRSWGNVIPRSLVAGTFRDRSSGATFAALNTHLDPFSPRSRLPAVRQVLDRIRRLGIPALLAGDLNARAGSRTIRDLFADGIVIDAWRAASERLTPEWDTYARYRPPTSTGRRIDWIAVTAGIRVRRIAVHAEPVDGGWPSDHLPVQAIVRVDERNHP